MKAVLISISPKYCKLIARGKKTVEVRKSKPKLETPFKVYIYCTKNKKKRVGDYLSLYCESGQISTDIKLEEPCYQLNGKVIGEFVCDEIKNGVLDISSYVDSVNIGSDETCLRIADIRTLLGLEHIDIIGQHKFYGWHISNLKIYNKPKELSEFKHCDGAYNLTRPPQNWCYVESEVQEDG